METQLQEQFEKIIDGAANKLYPKVSKFWIQNNGPNQEIAIEAMQQAYNLAIESKWIKVTDRLPEAKQRVLLLGVDGIIYMGHMADNKTWKTDIFYSHYKVEAWMPLPTPPQN